MIPHGNANSASTPRTWLLAVAHKKKLMIEKLKNILTSEAILQPSQTSMAVHSCSGS